MKIYFEHCVVCGLSLLDNGGAPDYMQHHYRCENRVPVLERSSKVAFLKPRLPFLRFWFNYLTSRYL